MRVVKRWHANLRSLSVTTEEAVNSIQKFYMINTTSFSAGKSSNFNFKRLENINIPLYFIEELYRFIILTDNKSKQ